MASRFIAVILVGLALGVQLVCTVQGRPPVTVEAYVARKFGDEQARNDAAYMAKSRTVEQAGTIIGNQSNQLVEIESRLQKKNYALIVAISDYAISTDLPGSVNSAYLWNYVFTNKFNCETVLLLNSDATLGNFKQEYEKMLTKAKNGDNCFLTFDMHGTYGYDVPGGDEPDDKDSILVFYTAQLPKGYLRDDELGAYTKQWLKDGVNLVVFCSTCYAGTMMKAVPTINTLKITYHDEPYTFFGACPKDKSSYQTSRFINTWTMGQYPNRWQNLYTSEMSYQVTEVLRNNPDITVTNLIQAVTKAVKYSNPVLEVRQERINSGLLQ